jgi:putative transcriptional regulator
MKNRQGLLLHNKIKVFRAIHNITQEQLAEKLGVTRQTVIAIESDKYLPSLALAFNLSRFFNCKIEDLFVSF